jgi:DNA repair protein RadC
MTTIIHKSTALVVFIQGDHLQDLQILIDDRGLYNALPGKLERHGIKTLAAWPVFVTAVLNEPRATEPIEVLAGHAVREGADPYQLPIFDLCTTAKPNGDKAHKRMVERTLAKIRELHDELNSQLYTHPTERPSIHSPADAFNILHPFLGPLDHEELWVLNLDTRNRVMSLTRLYQGSVNSSQIRVGEVFRQAITDNAPSLVVAHNHPSGDASPSPDDVSVTRAIVQAGKLLDIEVLDHIVVACMGFVSLKERGLGFGG